MVLTSRRERAEHPNRRVGRQFTIEFDSRIYLLDTPRIEHGTELKKLSHFHIVPAFEKEGAKVRDKPLAAAEVDALDGSLDTGKIRVDGRHRRQFGRRLKT